MQRSARGGRGREDAARSRARLRAEEAHDLVRVVHLLVHVQRLLADLRVRVRLVVVPEPPGELLLLAVVHEGREERQVPRLPEHPRHLRAVRARLAVRRDRLLVLPERLEVASVGKVRGLEVEAVVLHAHVDGPLEVPAGAQERGEEVVAPALLVEARGLVVHVQGDRHLRRAEGDERAGSVYLDLWQRRPRCAQGGVRVSWRECERTAARRASTSGSFAASRAARAPRACPMLLRQTCGWERAATIQWAQRAK